MASVDGAQPAPERIVEYPNVPLGGRVDRCLRLAFDCWLTNWGLSILLPAFLLALGTALLRFTDGDIYVSRLFFNEEDQMWPLLNQPANMFLYHYGVVPAWILAVAGLVCGLKLQHRRKPWLAAGGWYYALVIAIGPGLLINGLLKPHVRRPRPNQIAEFGGDHEYVPVLRRGTAAAPYLKSFPSGHASMGFILIVPAFALYRRRPKWSAAFVLIGLTMGTAVGAARIAQGRHFASDVLWSAALVYFTAILLHRLIGPNRTPRDSHEQSRIPNTASEPSVQTILKFTKQRLPSPSKQAA